MTMTVSQPSSRPKRADAIRNRERIFAAAKHCFAERGAATTMEDIARRAEVGVGSLYRAFGNRAGLAEAIFCDIR
jgi:AcrR family transcriptional regulator